MRIVKIKENKKSNDELILDLKNGVYTDCRVSLYGYRISYISTRSFKSKIKINGPYINITDSGTGQEYSIDYKDAKFDYNDVELTISIFDNKMTYQFTFYNMNEFYKITLRRV